jgi:hypothetical protein
VDIDIKTFIVDELSRVRQKYRIPHPWPTVQQLETLVNMAAGLFIFAATACAYIDAPGPMVSRTRLEQLCKFNKGTRKFTEPLDKMYTLVLNNSLGGDYEENEIYEKAARTRWVVGSIVTLHESLSPRALSMLIYPEQDEGELNVNDVLSSLQAVMYVNNDSEKHIRIIHQSFRDFLLDYERCVDPQFFVDETAVHYNLALQCIEIMDKYFCENICQIEFGTHVSEISEQSIARSIPPAVRYASVYWTEHVVNGQLGLEDEGLVHRFIRKYSLCYFEVVCLLGRAENGLDAFGKLYGLVDVSSHRGEVQYVCPC